MSLLWSHLPVTSIPPCEVSSPYTHLMYVDFLLNLNLAHSPPWRSPSSPSETCLSQYGSHEVGPDWLAGSLAMNNHVSLSQVCPEIFGFFALLVSVFSPWLVLRWFVSDMCSPCGGSMFQSLTLKPIAFVLWATCVYLSPVFLLSLGSRM